MKRTFRLSDVVPDPRRDVEEEVRFHLEMRARELIEQGMPEERAREEARRCFGDVTAIEAECRRVRGGRARERARRDLVHGLGGDVAHGARALARSPGFTLAAVLTLALGIGAAAAVFTIVDGVLLRPLPYRQPERLAMVWMTGQGVRGAEREWPLSPGFYLDVRKGVRGFESVAAFRSWPFVLSEVGGQAGGEAARRAGDAAATGAGVGTGGGASEPERVGGVRAAPALFATLGVRPLLGRTFSEREALPGAPRVAVISHGLWRCRFGGDPSAVGRGVTLSGERYQVIGVMPPGFAFPRGAELPPGLSLPVRTDVWAPLVFSGEDRASYGTLNLAAVARLAPGVSREQAEAEAVALGERRLAELGLPAGRLAFYLVGLPEQAAGKVRRGLLVLLGAVGLVLLVACANVANLLIARTGGRWRELAVRVALGAGRARIARQLATENLLLSLAGAAVGLLLAAGGTRAMLALVPGNLPRADDVSVDLRVIAAALAVAFLAGTVFGVAGALHLGEFGDFGRAGVAAALQGAGGRSTGTLGQRLGRRLLVVAEVALSLVLLVGAGLLGGSFARLQRVTPGFDPSHAFTAGVLLPARERFDFERDGPRWAAFFDRFTARLGALPGVRSAGAVSSLPLSGAVESGAFAIEGQPEPLAGEAPTTEYAVASGDYFRAMGIPILAGRAFDSRDRADGARVVVVSREFARRHFPGESAVGRRVRTYFDVVPGGPREIVGVVGDVKQTALDAETVPAAYVPQSQMPYPGLSIVVRTPGDPLAVLPLVKRELAALDPGIALADVRPLADVLADSLARQRFSLVVLGAFAGSALLLALVGLYGVIALSVGGRRREIGVRLALGARSRDVMRLVLGEGLRMTLLGVAIGLAGAFALTRVLQGLLFGLSTTDPRFFAAAAILVALVALAATYLPARRALRIDATEALKE